jgi:hypothetical protein
MHACAGLAIMTDGNPGTMLEMGEVQAAARSTSTARSGRFSTSSLMRASNRTFPTMPTLR